MDRLGLAAFRPAELGNGCPSENVEVDIGLGMLDKALEEQGCRERDGKPRFARIVELGDR